MESASPHKPVKACSLLRSRCAPSDDKFLRLRFFALHQEMRKSDCHKEVLLVSSYLVRDAFLRVWLFP